MWGLRPVDLDVMTSSQIRQLVDRAEKLIEQAERAKTEAGVNQRRTSHG